MDSPDILQAPPTAIGEQFLANGGGAPQPSSDPAPSLQPAPAPQSGQPSAAAPAPDPKHTAIGKMFSAITGGGSGTSASNFWRSLVGGAIVGMCAAENEPLIAGPY